MLGLPQKDIANLCYDGNVFLRGRKYYQEGAVTELFYDDTA